MLQFKNVKSEAHDSNINLQELTLAENPGCCEPGKEVDVKSVNQQVQITNY